MKSIRSLILCFDTGKYLYELAVAIALINGYCREWHVCCVCWWNGVKRFDSIKLKGNMQLLCRKLCQIGHIQAFEGLPGQKSRERRTVGKRFRQRTG
jgi:hypothetical protein